MIFIYGGFAQNKLQFTLDKFSLDKKDVFNGEEKNLSLLNNEKIITHFEIIIEKWLENNLEPIDEIKKIMYLLENKIIISCDVGCGIVPVDKNERNYRESVGRINCILAEKSEIVYRVCCGIGMVLKGGEKKCGY